MGFPILIRCHLYIEPGPRTLSQGDGWRRWALVLYWNTLWLSMQCCSMFVMVMTQREHKYDGCDTDMGETGVSYLYISISLFHTVGSIQTWSTQGHRQVWWWPSGIFYTGAVECHYNMMQYKTILCTTKKVYRWVKFSQDTAHLTGELWGVCCCISGRWVMGYLLHIWQVRYGVFVVNIVKKINCIW